MLDAATIDFDQPVPLFPLPQCLLLPYGTIPLHIFEPRYRRMVTDATATRELVAMALFEGDAWKHDYAGSPPIRPRVCVGHVLRFDPLPDGRSNILLRGVCRARIRREVDHSPYRLALVEPTEAQPAMDIDLADHRGKIEALLDDPRFARLAATATARKFLGTDLPTRAIVDLICMSLSDDSEQRYALLAEPNAGVRARWLERFLIATRRVIGVAERHGTNSGSLSVTLN